MPDYTPPSERVRQWVEDLVGPIHRISRLTGGLTADMDRLTIAGSDDVVLRRWGKRRWGAELVDREATGLRAIAGHGIPAPELIAADLGELAGEPCLLMTALPGRPLLEPIDPSAYAEQLATTLARLHNIEPMGLAASDPHGYDERRVDGWIRDPALAAAVKQAIADPSFQPVFIHGDYQALNVLWRDQRLSGVVDWTVAGSGRRETDVGLCRAALAILVSAEAAETFLRRYEAEAGVRIDPRADLRALMSHGHSWFGFLAKQRRDADPLQLEAVVRQAVRAVSRLG